MPSPDWLQHEMIVSGPPACLAAFRQAATGAAAIPWDLDLDAEEARLLAPMAAAGARARALAQALRDAIEPHDRTARAQVAGACPLDLHRLVPVPEAVLRLGRLDRAANRWLWENWGTTWPLRHVGLRATTDRRLRRSGRLAYVFTSADWTPWRAIARVRSN